MSLFEGAGVPLAARMRPRTLDELAGQRHAVGPGSLIRVMLDQDKPRSLVLVGPAGSGKTTIAHLVAAACSATFAELSATSAGVADVRKVVAEGSERRRATGQRTVLFLDEVHRFSKAQQDVLLPGVESGAIVLIGATTENPMFSIIAPLRSRSALIRLRALTGDEVVAVARRALTDERGLAGAFTAADELLTELAARAEGDARVALTALEAACDAAAADGRTDLSREDIDQALRARFGTWDRDHHYDVVSAFIKSLRGSDPDAALAWLVRMIAAGEDPRFIARRLVILASEDIGMADPAALSVAVAAAHAVEFVGLPEAEYALTQATVALALAPKSNAVARALRAAKEDLEKEGQGDVPLHLRDSHSTAEGSGRGYRYTPDFPAGEGEQEYLPAHLRGRRYWEP